MSAKLSGFKPKRELIGRTKTKAPTGAINLCALRMSSNTSGLIMCCQKRIAGRISAFAPTSTGAREPIILNRSNRLIGYMTAKPSKSSLFAPPKHRYRLHPRTITAHIAYHTPELDNKIVSR